MDSTRKREKKEKKRHEGPGEPAAKQARVMAAAAAVDEPLLPRGGSRVAAGEAKAGEKTLFATDEIAEDKHETDKRGKRGRGDKEGKQGKRGRGGDKGEDKEEEEEEDATAAVARHGRACKTVSGRNVRPGTLLLARVARSGAAGPELLLPHGLRCTLALGLEEPAEAFAPGDELAVAVSAAAPLRVTAEPAVVCQFVPPGEAEPGQAVVGRVASAEDRGWTVALPGVARPAFLARAQVPPELAPRLLPGRPLLACLLSPAGKKGGPAQLTLLQPGAAPRDGGLAALLPGMRLPRAQLAGEARQPEDGYRVAAAGAVAELHWTQLPGRRLPLPPLEPCLPMRVTWIDPDRAACGVTQLPWLVDTSSAPRPAAAAAAVVEGVFRATAVSVSGKAGVWLLAADGTPCHCSPALAADAAGKDAPPLEAAVAPGAQLACRLAREAADSWDGTLEVALAPALLRSRWLLPGELRAGEACSGSVEQVRPGGGAVLVLEGSGGRLRGLVPALHAPRDLRVGQTVRARVLDPAGRPLPLLTALRLLVADSEPPLTPDSLAVGRWGWGAVQGLQDGFAIVGFFGGLEALLPMSQCSYARLDSARSVLSLGQAVRARVLAVDAASGRVTVSLLEPRIRESTAALPPVASVVEGARVTRVAAGVGLELQLLGEARGFLPLQHLSDWPRLAAAAASEIQEGHVFERLVVWGHDARQGHAVCTAKHSYSALREQLPRTLADLADGAHVEVCCLDRTNERGAVLRVWQDLSLFCYRDRLTDAVGDAAALDLQPGKTLVGRVAGPADERGRRVMRCGLSAQPPDLGHLLQGYLAASRVRWAPGLHPGTVVSGTVAAAGAAAVVRLRGQDMMEYEAHVAASPAGGWRAGQAVRVAVVHVDPAGGRLDAVPAAVLEEAAREPGRVLWAGEEVAVLSGSVPGRLCLAAAQPEWAAQCLSLRAPSPAVPGSRWSVAPSRHAAGEAGWELAARLAALESAGDAAAGGETALRLGRVYELSVASVAQHHLNVRKSSGERGRVHLSELVEDDSPAPAALLAQFRPGAVVRAVYIGYRRRKDKSALAISHAHQETAASVNHHFSLRLARHAVAAAEATPALSRDTDRGLWLASVPVYGGPGVGEGAVLQGVVTEHAAGALWVHVSPYLRGRLFDLDAVPEREDVEALRERLPVGSRLRVRVAAVDAEERELDLLRDPPLRRIDEGAVTLCRVVSFKVTWFPLLCVLLPHVPQGESALLQYAAHGHARLHELDVDDAVRESSALGMLPQPGGLVYAALVRLPGRDFLDATTRPSVTGVPWGEGPPEPADSRFALLPWGAGLPAVGALVAGRVSSSGRGHDGVFVGLGQGMSARCPLRLVSDEFVETSEVAARFPAGRRVLCRVTRVEPETGRVEVALKASLCRRRQPLLTMERLRVGQVLHCDVNKVDERYGLFLTVRGGQGLTGLAHKSQIFESGTRQDFTAAYSKGDYVLAKVVSLEKGRIGFSIKPSAFTAEEREAMAAGDGEDDSDGNGNDNGDGGGGESSSEEEGAEEREEEAAAAASMQETAPALPSVGFFEETDRKKDKEERAGSSSSSSSEDEEGRRGARKRERGATEAEVEARERLLAKRQAQPETDEDFERLLMGAPNSSEVWVRWMSHKLAQGDPEAARSVAARALQRIAAARPRERANVWTALVNLETKYGSEASTEQLLARGAAELGRLEMDCRCLDALEREGAARAARTEEFAAGMLKRHAGAAECWLRVGQLFVRRGDGAKSGQVLQRALKQVADKEARILMTSRWAQSEFREGSVERGRTIFFGLLDNYPKRIDIMVVFLDMEEKHKDWQAARELYKRATALHLSSKKMRYFLRRWLEFEKQHGDERDVQLVTDTAKAFVESKTKKDESD